MTAYLFVYGTLMSHIGHPMHDVLARGAERLGEAFVQGRLYDLGRYPGLVLSAAADDRVVGEVYRLCDDAVLRALDDYEGCGPDAAEPTEYVRRIVPVLAADGKTVEAWAYIFVLPVEGLPRIASGRYRPRPVA